MLSISEHSTRRAERVTEMFKIALNAGHGITTPGRRCPAELDPAQTREWTLNDRVCTSVEERLKLYDVEVRRFDDTSGKVDRPLQERTDDANKWGADVWIGVHHNAAGKIFSGGGTVVYAYTTPTPDEVKLQSEVYKRSTYYTGLYGNRSNPIPRSNLHELRETNMTAVLIECGFMDSRVDCPQINSELFVERITNGIVEALVNVYGIIKKSPAKHYVKFGPFQTAEEAETVKEALLTATVSE